MRAAKDRRPKPKIANGLRRTDGRTDGQTDRQTDRHKHRSTYRGGAHIKMLSIILKYYLGVESVMFLGISLMALIFFFLLMNPSLSQLQNIIIPLYCFSYIF